LPPSCSGDFALSCFRFDASAIGPDAISQFSVYDSAHSSHLTAAQREATGISGDWVKEIHPSPAGNNKIETMMGAWIDDVLASSP